MNEMDEKGRRDEEGIGEEEEYSIMNDERDEEREDRFGRGGRWERREDKDLII
jgi:hypothetical protein